MGFKEQLNEILHKLPAENRQTLLFSATLPESLVEFARAGLQNPLLIRLDVESKLSDKLRLAFIQCRNQDKLAILIYLLKNIIKATKNPIEFSDKSQSESNISYENTKNLKQTLIFVATKHHVEFLKDVLNKLGYNVAYAYSSLDQAARLMNISKFQNKRSSIMIVTDVAARGIDIPMLDNVINVNFPAKAKLFVHRVGRVARAGQYGNSYTLVAEDEVPFMLDLHQFLDKDVKLATNDMNAEGISI
jgi:ATP-dependent RNA helicase DDX54/DBP10